jgi:hypothetical protein
MKHCFKSRKISRIALIVLAGTFVMAGAASAASDIGVNYEQGQYISITAAQATVNSDGLHVEGSLQRRHFTPRGPIAGLVTVSVQNAEGNVIQEQTMQTSSLFVPKGIRQAHFSGVLDGSFPEGSTVTIKSLN